MEDNTELSFVTFKEKSFSVEVHTFGSPMEDWQSLFRALLWYVGHDDENTPPEYRLHLTNLLNAMLPVWKVAKKMESKA